MIVPKKDDTCRFVQTMWMTIDNEKVARTGCPNDGIRWTRAARTVDVWEACSHHEFIARQQDARIC